jgi:GT2 family glycosyltransferase
MHESDKPQVSIIIVNYNSSGLLANCIDSIINHLTVSYEVIVFDNNSTDNSLHLVEKNKPNYSQIKLIRSNENVGFAKANNNAMLVATGPLIHFLNPDTVVNSSLNSEYEEILAKKKTGIFVTGIYDHDGKTRKMRHLIPTIKNWKYLVFRSRKVGYWNIGASIIMDRLTYLKIGGWPENYFMYAEDLDLFYTAWKSNIPVAYLDCSIGHAGEGTTSKVWTQQQRLVLIEKSTRKFYRKYHMTWQYFLIRPIQFIFILIREPHTFILSSKAFVKSFFK